MEIKNEIVGLKILGLKFRFNDELFSRFFDCFALRMTQAYHTAYF
jgi:hypothetical protein